MQRDWQFPIYRKYPNNRSFFKIISLERFEELTLMGSKVVRHNIVAKIHPDRVLIVDMLEMLDRMWLESNAAEFEVNQ
jgi:hypothetical protein